MTSAPWYVEAFRSDYREVYAHRNLAAAREEVRWLVEDVLAGARGVVLDDCCGFGRHGVAMSERGLDVVGIDLSFDLLRGARELEEESDAAALLQVIKDTRSCHNAAMVLVSVPRPFRSVSTR